MSRLRPEELAACRAAFSKYDTDRCGRMSNWDLKGALTGASPSLPRPLALPCLTSSGCAVLDADRAAMGWKCSDGDIFRMLTQLDGEASTSACAGRAGQPDAVLVRHRAPEYSLTRRARLPRSLVRSQ